MAITLRDLRGLEGPNLYYGQPCVKFEVWADRDIRRQIGDTIKSWAQATGIVIGSIEQTVVAAEDGFIITTTFLTPFPSVGERVCEGVLADLKAAEQPDAEYTHDELLFEVIRERKREEPSLPLLQLHAEARAHGVRLLPRDDGKVMIGTGKQGYLFDPAMMSMGMAPEIPWDRIGQIPLVAVTGTNGKTTIVRLIAHVVASLGLTVGRTDTDGVYVGEQRVEEGDWAGFAGARRVMTDPMVDVAVLETSRGGILRRGLAFDEGDVGVITNVTEDHLHELGIETVEAMARVKGVVALVTRPDGYVVLNADDPHVWELRNFVAATVVAVSRMPQRPEVEAYREAGGPTVVLQGDEVEVRWSDFGDSFPLSEAPITVGGAATHNVENVLLATAACFALGVPFKQIRAALTTFMPDREHNLGRMNIFRREGQTVVMDYAHNEAGWKALLALGERLRQDDGSIIVVIGGPGDRPDDQIREQGRLAAEHADRLLIHEEERYLRGRSPGEVPALYQEGAVAGGLAADRIETYQDDMAALEAAVGALGPHDVILAAVHVNREACLERLERWQAGQSFPAP